jgi:hypothetical protein
MKATKQGKLIFQELVTVTKDGPQVVRLNGEPPTGRVIGPHP